MLAFETSKPVSSNTPPPTRLYFLILPTQFHKMVTQHSNIWTNGSHCHSNHYTLQELIFLGYTPSSLCWLDNSSHCKVALSQKSKAQSLITVKKIEVIFTLFFFFLSLIHSLLLFLPGQILGTLDFVLIFHLLELLWGHSHFINNFSPMICMEGQ